jgi:hypothetical protein
LPLAPHDQRRDGQNRPGEVRVFDGQPYVAGVEWQTRRAQTPVPERGMQVRLLPATPETKGHTLKSNSILYFFRYPMRLLIRGEGRAPREEAHR